MNFRRWHYWHRSKNDQSEEGGKMPDDTPWETWERIHVEGKLLLTMEQQLKTYDEVSALNV